MRALLARATYFRNFCKNTFNPLIEACQLDGVKANLRLQQYIRTEIGKRRTQFYYVLISICIQKFKIVHAIPVHCIQERSIKDENSFSSYGRVKLKYKTISPMRHSMPAYNFGGGGSRTCGGGYNLLIWNIVTFCLRSSLFYPAFETDFVLQVMHIICLKNDVKFPWLSYTL